MSAPAARFTLSHWKTPASRMSGLPWAPTAPWAVSPMAPPSTSPSCPLATKIPPCDVSVPSPPEPKMLCWLFTWSTRRSPKRSSMWTSPDVVVALRLAHAVSLRAGGGGVGARLDDRLGRRDLGRAGRVRHRPVEDDVAVRVDVDVALGEADELHADRPVGLAHHRVRPA